jgi:hypothetical protein
MTEQQEAWLVVRKLLLRLDNIAALRLAEITIPHCSLNDAVLRLEWALNTLNNTIGVGQNVDNYLVQDQERG